MKPFILVLLVCFFSFRLEAQDCTELKNDPEIRQELQDLANTAANKLMNCCSSFGGRNNRAEIHWEKDETGVCRTRISRLTNKITITMTAYWNGSVSGAQYWIKGRLVVDMENRTQTWEKISDSGGFSGGCGKSCIN